MRTIIITILLALFGALTGLSKSHTILITEGSTNYTEQYWFYPGFGNSLQEDLIKKHWDEGRRITSVAYTDHGWFVTMAKNCGLTAQFYYKTSSWPTQWVKDKYNEGYYITSLAYGNGTWLVVMSMDNSTTNQMYKGCYLNEIDDYVKSGWDKGFYITNMTYNGSYWLVVMSKTNKYVSQGYYSVDASSSVKETIKPKIWDKGYNIQTIDACGNIYVVVYCKYAQDNSRAQNFVVDPSNPKSYIQEAWDDNREITYIGGGETNTYSTSPSTSSSTTTSPSTTSDDTHTRIPCPSCHQTGKCTSCGGSGIFMGMSVCTVCAGTGKCSMCVGTGIMSIQKVPATPSPSNNSNNNNNNNNSSPSSPTYTTCKYCSGSGNCTTCHGARKTKQWDYTIKDYLYKDCPVCNGTGRCGVCRGTGRL